MDHMTTTATTIAANATAGDLSSSSYYYWEPHTSSIDFCETNYVHFRHVVEFHNTWSSLLGIASFGVIGMIWNNPLREWRTFLAYLILVIIGVGSAGLHLSLHWIFQSSDELPMLYMSNVVNFMALEYNAPRGKPNYGPLLPYWFGLWTILQTIVYYRFQDQYFVFLWTYGIGVVGHIYTGYKEVYLKMDQRGPIVKYFTLVSFLTYSAFGFPMWVLDMKFCDAILSVADQLPLGLLRGITPHVLWHFGAAFGTYCCIGCAVTCRMEELNVPFRLSYFMGMVPIAVRTDAEEEATEGASREVTAGKDDGKKKKSD